MKKFERFVSLKVTEKYVKQALAAFMLSLAVRLLLFNYYYIRNPDCFFDFWDAYLYVHDAKLLNNLGVFGDPPYPGIFRTPLYIVFVAAVFYMTHYSNAAIILIQIIMSSMTGALIYIISSKWVSRWSAFIVSAAFAIDILSVTYANRIMSEVPFTFLLVLMVFFFTKFMESGKKRYLAAAGIMAGAAVLIRPILFYFPLLMPLIFTAYYRRQIKRVILNFLIFALCFYGIVGPWLVRNYSLGYHGIAAVQEFNIYMYKAGWIDEKLKGKTWPASINFDERFARIDHLIGQRGLENTPYNRVMLYKEQGMQTLKRHPFRLAQYQVFYTARVFLKTGTAAIYEKFPEISRGEKIRIFGRLLSYGYAVLLTMIYILFLIGMSAKRSWNRSNIGPFIIFLFLYMTLLSGEMGGEARFRIPILPIMLIMAASGIESAFKLLRQPNMFNK